MIESLESLTVTGAKQLAKSRGRMFEERETLKSRILRDSRLTHTICVSGMDFFFENFLPALLLGLLLGWLNKLRLLPNAYSYANEI